MCKLTVLSFFRLKENANKIVREDSIKALERGKKYINFSFLLGYI